MTPQLLPPTPSPAGGSATAPTATAAADSCLSLPIPAAATVAAPLPGKPNFKLNSAIALGSPGLSLTIPVVLPNGIPSSIACFPKSPKPGPPSLSTVTPKSSTSFAIPTPEPGSQSRLTSTAGIIPLAPHPIQSRSAVFASNDIRLCPPGTIRLLRCESIVASALSAGYSLERSHEISTGDERRFREALARAKEELLQAKATVTTGYSGESELFETMENIILVADTIRSEMAAKKKAPKA